MNSYSISHTNLRRWHAMPCLLALSLFTLLFSVPIVTAAQDLEKLEPDQSTKEPIEPSSNRPNKTIGEIERERMDAALAAKIAELGRLSEIFGPEHPAVKKAHEEVGRLNSARMTNYQDTDVEYVERKRAIQVDGGFNFVTERVPVVRQNPFRDEIVPGDYSNELNRQRQSSPFDQANLNRSRFNDTNSNRYYSNSSGYDPETAKLINETEQKIRMIGSELAAADESQQDELKQELKAQLEIQYDAYLEHHEKPLKQLEARLAKLRAEFDARAKAKDDLVKLRLDTMWYQSRGLAWPSNAPTAGYRPGDGNFEPRFTDRARGMYRPLLPSTTTRLNGVPLDLQNPQNPPPPIADGDEQSKPEFEADRSK